MRSVEDVVVPGARLHTEVRGSGPLLVCVVGGNGDPTVFDPLADILAPRWTVLTYVRRGFVRSPIDDEVGPDKLGDDVEDLARLIERHGGPAVVLGSSSGAIVVLELLVRRPDLVRAAIAHEPPLITLLKDRDAIATRFDAVLATYRGEGAGGDGRVRRGHRGGHTSPAARAGAGRDPPGVPRHAGAVAGEQRVLVRARVRPLPGSRARPPGAP